MKHGRERVEERKRKRQELFVRSGGKCESCGREATDAHHLTCARFGNELLEDLLALCRYCHDRKHGVGKKARKKKVKRSALPVDVRERLNHEVMVRTMKNVARRIEGDVFGGFLDDVKDRPQRNRQIGRPPSVHRIGTTHPGGDPPR